MRTPIIMNANRSRSGLISNRNVIVLALLGMASVTHAAENDSHVSAMRYVALDTQVDNAEFSHFSGTGSFTLGKYVWLQGTLGRITDNSDATLGDLQQYGLGAGFRTEHLQATLNFSDYQGDASYEQRDLLASLDWLGARYTVGLDIFRRSTHSTANTIRDFPALNLTNVTLYVDEELTGNGIGLHADFYLTDDLDLSLGGMSYDYDSDYTLTASSNPLLIRRLLAKYPTISELIYQNISGVTRSLALFESSYNIGLSYQFSSMALTGQYLHDEALASEETLDTASLSATMLVGDNWMLAALLGQSRSASADGVTFGGLSISYNW